MLLRGNLNDQIEAKIRELQYQCNTLSRQLSKSGYLDGRDDGTINSTLSVLSDVYDGRILLVSKTFKIEKDTYSIDEGKLNISEMLPGRVAGGIFREKPKNSDDDSRL